MVNPYEPIFLTYYTDTRYMQHFWHLFDSAQRLGISIEPHFQKSLGSWQKNTQYKAQFLLDKRKDSAYDGRPIVWVDVDARFRQYPVLFKELAKKGVDLAAHVFLRRELASGTVYIGDTPQALTLLKDWVERCESNPKELDQRSLQVAVDESEGGLYFYDLPPEYCYIFDLSKIHYPGVDPVIEHMQASRQAKKKG